MRADNESADTFSFGLVLLCLAVGNIAYLQTRGRLVTTSSYALGWRPPIPDVVSDGCADLAALIAKMWDGDFRKRPSLKLVVSRLEASAAASLDAVGKRRAIASGASGVASATGENGAASIVAVHSSEAATAQHVVEEEEAEEEDDESARLIARLRAALADQRAQIEAQRDKLEALEGLGKKVVRLTSSHF